MKIKLPAKIDGGTLSANKAAEVVIGDATITLKLVAATALIR